MTMLHTHKMAPGRLTPAINGQQRPNNNPTAAACLDGLFSPPNPPNTAMPPLLDLPRELREEILRYLTLPRLVYTSSTTADTHAMHRSKKTDDTYLDTRICLPSRPPANVLATCRQLREECLAHHNHLLNSSTPIASHPEQETQKSQSRILAERSSTDFDEAAERVVDLSATVRLTLEVQRGFKGSMGYYTPTRDALSPRFLALLPLMQKAKKLKLVVWPGFDWLDGERPPSIRFPRPPRPNALTVAIEKILEQIPATQELSIDIFIATGDLFRWDLPDAKWAKIQPWLDRCITPIDCPALKKVSRTLATVWQAPDAATPGHQPIYEQSEVRIGSGNTWNVKRQGGLRTPYFERLAAEHGIDLPDVGVDEEFVRTD